MLLGLPDEIQGCIYWHLQTTEDRHRFRLVHSNLRNSPSIASTIRRVRVPTISLHVEHFLAFLQRHAPVLRIDTLSVESDLTDLVNRVMQSTVRMNLVRHVFRHVGTVELEAYAFIYENNAALHAWALMKLIPTLTKGVPSMIPTVPSLSSNSDIRKRGKGQDRERREVCFVTLSDTSAAMSQGMTIMLNILATERALIDYIDVECGFKPEPDVLDLDFAADASQELLTAVWRTRALQVAVFKATQQQHLVPYLNFSDAGTAPKHLRDVDVRDCSCCVGLDTLLTQAQYLESLSISNVHVVPYSEDGEYFNHEVDAVTLRSSSLRELYIWNFNPAQVLNVRMSRETLPALCTLKLCEIELSPTEEEDPDTIVSEYRRVFEMLRPLPVDLDKDGSLLLSGCDGDVKELSWTNVVCQVIRPLEDLWRTKVVDLRLAVKGATVTNAPFLDFVRSTFPLLRYLEVEVSKCSLNRNADLDRAVEHLLDSLPRLTVLRLKNCHTNFVTSRALTALENRWTNGNDLILEVHYEWMYDGSRSAANVKRAEQEWQRMVTSRRIDPNRVDLRMNWG